MSKTDDGGSAFPKYFGGNFNLAPGEEAGMSLRDYFAAQALTGVLSTLAAMDDAVRNDVDRFARDCYRMADAMLAERAK